MSASVRAARRASCSTLDRHATTSPAFHRRQRSSSASRTANSGATTCGCAPGETARSSSTNAVRSARAERRSRAAWRRSPPEASRSAAARARSSADQRRLSAAALARGRAHGGPRRRQALPALELRVADVARRQQQIADDRVLVALVRGLVARVRERIPAIGRVERDCTLSFGERRSVTPLPSQVRRPGPEPAATVTP